MLLAEEANRDGTVSPMSIKPILTGLGCAVVAQFLALGLTGAGHGWVAPFFYSPLLFVAYPIVLARLIQPSRRMIWIEIMLLAAAVAADTYLAANALGSEASYVNRVMAAAPAFLVLWLCLWSAWQPLLIWLLLRGLRSDG